MLEAEAIGMLYNSVHCIPVIQGKHRELVLEAEATGMLYNSVHGIPVIQGKHRALVLEAEATENNPKSQAWQTSAKVALTDVEYVPVDNNNGKKQYK